MNTNLSLSVLIPTYKRFDVLLNCLDALKKQYYKASQIIIVVRDSDKETQEYLGNFDKENLPIEIVFVSEPGVVAAMNKGLSKITSDITVLTDDDTTAPPNWLAQIAKVYEDSEVGGVGGRDWQEHNATEENPLVGIVLPYGKTLGNHHIGVGPARSVDILKGANASFRTQPLKEIGFDTRLLGSGAQVHWELGICFAFKKAGWKLIYDPNIVLTHHIAPRLDADSLHRNGIFHAESYHNMVYNETLFLWHYLSTIHKFFFFLWFHLIGIRASPGILITIYDLLRYKNTKRIILGNHLKARYSGIKNVKSMTFQTISGPSKK
jgi:cellulose synthase/poly-beta-1,6-N-acetylglucosamine synthase-like glycosyltransferase